MRVISLLVVSSWCGLVSGLLEVAAIVARKQWLDPNQLYGMSHHFVWLIPLTNLVLFLAVAFFSDLASFVAPRAMSGLVPRVLCAFTLLPVLLVGIPGVYGLAWLPVTLGVAAWVVPLLERHAGRFKRAVVVSFPLVVGAIAVQPVSTWCVDRIRYRDEAARPMPPSAAPNVLLVVMDTVAAGHVALNGYARPTSTTLIELAERGIHFNSARSASPWTLSSHATMFTGRWLHELSVGWFTPLNGTYPTVAEFLGSRGYATAGFVANYTYCARDSGLARGFTHYQDFIFPGLTCFKMSAMVNRGLAGVQLIQDFLERDLGVSSLRPYLKYLWWLVDTDRKGAAVVNREFVDWLSERRRPERPFFAFLNYFDAHSPYQLPAGRSHRFGAVPVDNNQRDLIQNWWDLDKTVLAPEEIEFAVNAYDDCIADLDEQIGVLVDELERLGALKRTWLIVVADHGESFGEHTGVFGHGMSLYQTEVHVPLLIVPPGGTAAKQVVSATVSLRDLAATVVDVVGMAEGSPFPGGSLARHWKTRPSAPNSGAASAAVGLAEVVPSDPNKRGSSGHPITGWPLGGLADGEWSYVRREHDAREELFHLRIDANEQRNLVDDPAAKSRLEQMRAELKTLTGGPLTPDRFSP